MPQPSECRYQLDAVDRIREVDAGWETFAQGHGTVALARGAVLGRSVYDFIDGGEVRHLYRLLFAAARRSELPMRLPFRCDAPGLRRYMELEVSADEKGYLDLTSRLLRTEPRAPVPLLETPRPEHEPFVVVCSWCKRVHTGPGRWEEVEAAVRTLDLFGERPLPGLSHGICDVCDRELAQLAEAEDERAERAS